MKSHFNTEHYLDRRDAATYLGVAYETMRVWASIKRDKLPYYKVGKLVRYKIEDLDNYIKSRLHDGKTDK